jgi:hypothetical protein
MDISGDCSDDDFQSTSLLVSVARNANMKTKCGICCMEMFFLVLKHFLFNLKHILDFILNKF